MPHFVPISPRMKALGARRMYVLEVKPYYRGNRVTFDAYEALLIEHERYDRDSPSRIVWRTVATLRRDAKRLGDEALAQFRYAAEPTPVLRRNQDKRGFVPAGMLGLKHSPESRAKISAALKRRHEEGAFRTAALGRPSKDEARRRLAAEAALHGLTPLALAQQREREKRLLDQRRTEAALRHAAKRPPRSKP